MIKSGRGILKTRRDIIKFYKKPKNEKIPNLIELEQIEETEETEEDKETEEDQETEDKILPDWVGVSGKRFNEIKKNN